MVEAQIPSPLQRHRDLSWSWRNSKVALSALSLSPQIVIFVSVRNSAWLKSERERESEEASLSVTPSFFVRLQVGAPLCVEISPRVYRHE